MGVSTESALTSIGDCLRTAREQLGLTLEQAAELSGISKSHLSRLESSDRQPSVASLLALSAAFGVSVGALFGETQGAAPLKVTIPVGRPAPVPARHPGEEWIYVLSGTLRLEYGGEVHFLEPGTAAHFN